MKRNSLFFQCRSMMKEHRSTSAMHQKDNTSMHLEEQIPKEERCQPSHFEPELNFLMQINVIKVCKAQEKMSPCVSIGQV